MRTTITISDDVYQSVKVLAAQTDRTVGSVVEGALRRFIAEASSMAFSNPPTLPLHQSGGLRAGVNPDDMSAVRELLDDGLSLDVLR
jgi:hypothetical protein